MIYLHTFGDTLIKVGEKEIRPTSPMVFAALLYLGMERGRRVPRAALQELLFPNADERSGAHSLRQLLYKLRQLGVPVATDGSTVSLPASAVEAVSSDQGLLDGDHDCLDRASRGVLPSYHPALSDAFERWLDDKRASITTQLCSILLKRLARCRETGDQQAIQEPARALLALDPFNEEATLARAEAFALNGQKREAVRLLEEYSAEVGRTSPELRLPAEILRRRIHERFEVGKRLRVPLVGRRDELSWLLAQFGRASAGHPTVTIVWGDAGVGKTRLVQEFGAHLILRNARIQSTHCQPHDVERPLGALIDLVPKLLEARGALGVSPRSMKDLRRLAGDVPADAEDPPIRAELLAARIREAVVDLFVCIAAEAPLVLLVEDSQWLDHASFRFLLTAALAQRAGIHLVLTQRDRPRFPEGVPLSESVFVRQLEPLCRESAAELLVHAVGAGFVLSDSTREQCVALGAGNPLFLCTIAEHLLLRGTPPSASASVVDLLRQRIKILDSHALLFLRFVAALGNYGSRARLAACAGLSAEAELLALQDLADRGLVTSVEGVLKCSHDLLTEVVLSDAPAPIRDAIFERVATLLEQDGIAGKQVNLLWSCAESWRLAGNRERAKLILLRCAEFALDIGQPVFACSALEKAQELAAENDRLPLIEQTIRIAELAFDDESVLRNVNRYRESIKALGLAPPQNHSSELAEVHALRRSGHSVWHLREQLRRFALDKRAPASFRMRAARIFLASAEQNLAKADAIHFFEEVVTTSSTEATSIDYLHVRMLFNISFGDVSQGLDDAHAILASLPNVEESSRRFLRANIAVALTRGGAFDEAVDLITECAHTHERLGLVNQQIVDYARLAEIYRYLGDTSMRQVYHDKADRILKENRCNSIAMHFANGIDFALMDGELDRARANLRILRAFPEAKHPHAIRTIRGFELLIAMLDGSFQTDQVDFDELDRIDERGREACEHNVFALSLWMAYVASGQHAKGDSRLRDYVHVWRRERFSVVPYFEGLGARAGLSDRLAEALATAH